MKLSIGRIAGNSTTNRLIRASQRTTTRLNELVALVLIVAVGHLFSFELTGPPLILVTVSKVRTAFVVFVPLGILTASDSAKDDPIIREISPMMNTICTTHNSRLFLSNRDCIAEIASSYSLDISERAFCSL